MERERKREEVKDNIGRETERQKETEIETHRWKPNSPSYSEQAPTWLLLGNWAEPRRNANLLTSGMTVKKLANDFLLEFEV